MNLNSGLFADFYELTMAYGYWRLEMCERESVFQLFFRKHPFHGQYAISCGLADVIDYIKHWHFTQDELAYLQTLKDVKKKPLFPSDFLDYLSSVRFTGDVHAMPEGQIVFSQEPLLRVTAPLIQAQLLETALINRIGFASLIATKASRVCLAAQNDPVIEFGLRRAQGPDGGMTASRACFIGGCESTSNTLSAMVHRVPPRGTMAHSWVMAFPDELASFESFAKVMPDSTILLVDTYDTVQGVHHAIQIGRKLREQGSDLLGIRLDSGDLNDLSKKARKLLDGAGFTQTKIVASGDLDEHIIEKLKQQGAPIDIWGVGTRMTTGWEQPALDLAYKLTAIRDEQGVWQDKMKRSDNPAKTTNPGILQVRRFSRAKRWIADIIYDVETGVANNLLSDGDHQEDLLVPIFRQGQCMYHSPEIHDIQSFCQKQLSAFIESGVTEYPVQLEARLQAMKDNLLRKTR